MIIDKIENIFNYKSLISEDIIKFLLSQSPETKPGRYKINSTVFANVDVYPPKPYDNCKFEAHKKYIDIQMLLSGEEDLEYTLAAGLEILEDYNEEKDVFFMKNPKTFAEKVHLTPYRFVYILPHEAHKPQIKTKQGTVKKVVVKIPV